ncbi:MAG: hypothetical protein QW533_02610 [Thermoplasmata archaeon]
MKYKVAFFTMIDPVLVTITFASNPYIPVTLVRGSLVEFVIYNG